MILYVAYIDGSTLEHLAEKERQCPSPRWLVGLFHSLQREERSIISRFYCPGADSWLTLRPIGTLSDMGSMPHISTTHSAVFRSTIHRGLIFAFAFR